MQNIPYLVIVNRTKVKRFPHLAESPLLQNGDVVYTDAPKHAIELAKAAEEYPLVVAAGGDGTVHEVANGLLSIPRSDRPMMAILPIGSGNDLARVLGGIESDDVPNLSMLARTYPHPTYLVEMDGKVVHGVNVADIGLGGATVQALDNRYRAWKAMAYPMAILHCFLTYKGFQASVSVDGKERLGRFLTAAFGTGNYFGRGLGILPQESTDLKAALIGDVSYWTYLKKLKALRKKQRIQHPQISYSEPKEILISTQDPTPIQIDGENYGSHDEFRIIVGGSLRMVVP